MSSVSITVRLFIHYFSLDGLWKNVITWLSILLISLKFPKIKYFGRTIHVVRLLDPFVDLFNVWQTIWHDMYGILGGTRSWRFEPKCFVIDIIGITSIKNITNYYWFKPGGPSGINSTIMPPWWYIKHTVTPT